MRSIILVLYSFVGYMSEGFLTLQHQINVGLIRALDPNVSEHSLHVQLQRFPYPPYLDDNFVLVIQQQLPSIILISFIFSALQIVKEVVHEKEHKLKVCPSKVVCTHEYSV